MVKAVPRPRALVTSMRPPIACISVRTTSMPTPRPASSVTEPAVDSPDMKTSWTCSASESACSGVSSPLSMALARSRSRSRPAPSSLTMSTTSFASWRRVMLMRPPAGLPPLARVCGSSIPCTRAFLSRCSSGAAMRSSTPRSSSTCPPSSASSALRPSSRAVCRTRRCNRSARLAKGTARMRIRLCCSSRPILACCKSAASVSPTFLTSACCRLATSARPSAIMRVSSCSRV